VYVTLPGEIKKTVEYLSFDYKATKYKGYNIPYIGNFMTNLLKIPKTYAFSTSFLNNGNVSNDVKVTLKAKDMLFDVNNEEIEITQKIGRDTEAKTNTEWKAPLFGKFSFTAEGVYQTKDGEETFETSTITIWVIPWDLVAAEGLLLLALITIVVIRKLQYSAKKWKKYKITKKDTLQSLSVKHKVKWEKLAEVNKIEPPYELKPGTVILVPKSSSKKK
jgi:LysM repeat protein